MSIAVDWQAEDGKSACRIESAGVVWASDAPVQFGGSGEYPDPHALLDSALGACTVLIIEMYAKRKGYALQGVTVEVTSEESSGVYRLHKQITLTGDLDTAAREDLFRMAEHCPIHKTLMGRFEISAQLQHDQACLL